MCPSVQKSGLASGSQTTFLAPSHPSRISVAVCLLIPGLRLGLRIEVSVQIRVPSPSTSSAPPSTTIGALNWGTPTCCRIWLASFASLLWTCLSPHPLKFQVEPASPPWERTRNEGPVSRAHKSSIITSKQSTVGPQRRCASAFWFGRTATTTGSNREIAWAMVAMSPRTISSCFPQMSCPAGQAIQHLLCGAPSADMYHPCAAGGDEASVASAGPNADPNKVAADSPSDDLRKVRRDSACSVILTFLKVPIVD